jgi:glycosyltransferase involved in cell wall biosynthesis
MIKNVEAFNFVLPSLKISGGIKESISISNELKQLGANVENYVMWVSPSEVSTAPFNSIYLSKYTTNHYLAVLQIPFILFKFFLIEKRKRCDEQWFFTHYAALPLALCVPRDKRIFLVQGVEWDFVRNKFISAMLRKLILAFYRNGRIVTTNQYLSRKMNESGLTVSAELQIWANESFYIESDVARDIDIVMVLRSGDTKRLDLYREFIRINNVRNNRWNIAVITPDDDINAFIKPLVSECYVRPSIVQMATIYARSKIFLMLSEHEGFGLPPLEAMGAGCVPICRDSGGIRTYMTGELANLVVPLEWDLSKIIDYSDSLLNGGSLELYSILSKKIFKSRLIDPASRGRLLLNLN